MPGSLDYETRWRGWRRCTTPSVALAGIESAVSRFPGVPQGAAIRDAVCAQRGFLKPFELLVIPAREDLSILREVVRVLGWR